MFDDIYVLAGGGNQIILPALLHAQAIRLAHEGHQATDRTVNLLRQTCWFPAMRKQVIAFVDSCIACAAATNRNSPVPLEPNVLPDRPWQKLHCDFKGPIASKYYLHVIIDQYSKFPEVDVVTSTSFEKLKPVMDRVLAFHGIPETMSSDNGPPYPSFQMSEYAKSMGFQMTPVSPEDPQCNGFAEVFMKPLAKVVHTAVVEKKDPKAAVQMFLMQYRATPHSTTGISPAELLFNRRIKTKLPQVFPNVESLDSKAVRDVHNEKREQQKSYFDKKKKARGKNVQPGMTVLVKQKKTTTQPPYNPEPFTVQEISGNRVTMVNKHGVKKVRDKNKIKLLKERPAYLRSVKSALATPRHEGESHSDMLPMDSGRTMVTVTDAAPGEPSATVGEAQVPGTGQTTDESTGSEPANDLFEVDASLEDRMQALLEDASARSTRSSGRQLSWRRTIDPQCPLEEVE